MSDLGRSREGDSGWRCAFGPEQAMWLTGLWIFICSRPVMRQTLTNYYGVALPIDFTREIS